MCSRAGPAGILTFVAADATNTKYWMSSPRLLEIFTCHCIRISRVSNAKFTITSWHRIAMVFDSLSKVNPDSMPRKCSRDKEALVGPFLYRSLESL